MWHCLTSPRWGEVGSRSDPGEGARTHVNSQPLTRHLRCRPLPMGEVTRARGTTLPHAIALPHKGLRRAHISEAPSLNHLFEALPTSSHGDRTWRTLGSVAG